MRHNVVSKGNTKSPTDKGQISMALNVQMIKYHNQMIDEDIVVPRLVNQQSMSFNELCDYLADGSTVTAADVAAVMKQIESRLPLVLGLNAKVVCSPEGLTFRPTVSGSITQSELKQKLEVRKADETDPQKAEKIDVNRALTLSDLTVSDLTASIAIDLPKAWNDRFHSKASFKRIDNSDKEKTSIADNSGDENGDSGSTGNTGGGSGNPGSGELGE